MAIILWESLSGKRLFRAENQAATLNKICLEPIPMPSSVDPALAVFDPILERGLARDPNLRFQSAEEFAEAIEESAPMLGGLAKQREVAQLVREYASEKLNKDADLIRDAIAQLAANNPSEPAASISAPISPEPPPPASLPPPPRVFAPPPAAVPNLVAPAPVGLPPAPFNQPTAEIFSQLREPLPMLDLEPHEGAPSSKRWIWIAAIFTLTAAVGITVLLSMRDDHVRPVPLDRDRAVTVEAPPPTPTAPVEAPPEPPPAAEPAAKTPPAQHEARERPSRRSQSTEPRETTEPSAQPSQLPAETAAPTPPPREAPAATTTQPTTPRRRTREGDSSNPGQTSKPNPPDDLLLNPYR
jgi:serine/threonine-protein kinase